MKTTKAILVLVFLTCVACGKRADVVTGPDVSAQPQQQVEQAGPGTLQVVIFFANNNEIGLQNLANTWLSQNNEKIEIVQILQSQSGRETRKLVISIFYKIK